MIWGVKVFEQMIIAMSSEQTEEKKKQGWLLTNLFCSLVAYLVYNKLGEKGVVSYFQDFSSCLLPLLAITLAFDFSNLVTASARWDDGEGGRKVTPSSCWFLYSAIGVGVYFGCSYI